MSEILKYFSHYWKENEARRLEEAAQIAKEEKGLAERKAKLGLKP